jgi:hypothetical protein
MANSLRALHRIAVVGLACIAAIAGCARDSDGVADRDVDPTEPEPEVTAASAALVALRTCDDVDDAVRGAAKRAMKVLLASKLEDTLQRLEDGDCYVHGGWADAGVAVEDSAGAGGSGPSAVSETNNQVEGVDEADFVKNDDGHIYVLADGALQIVEAWPAADARVVSRTELQHAPQRMFVAGDRALVFMSKRQPMQTTESYDDWWYDRDDECTYGYDCDFTGDGNATELALYDIADRSAPRLVRTIELSGSYLSARRIGSAVHVMVYDEPELLRTLAIVPEELEDDGACTGTDAMGNMEVAAGDDERAKDLFAALERTNLAAIEAAPIAELSGSVSDTLAGQDAVSRDPCQGFYDSPLVDGTSLLSLVSLDLQSDDAAQISTIISLAGATYASSDAYYVAVRQRAGGGGWYADFGDVAEASTVHQFALAGPNNTYVASGLVKGRVLNQFAMDEHAGHLRIATTTGHVPDPAVHSTLSILEREGGDLKTVGVVDDVAPTEDIRSVRFQGDRGYVVTFKKTDPLFVFDLADPEHPEIVGELKIPGFSTYMHPLDADHLLAIGFEAADQGDFAYFQGLQLQVFDVSDPATPTLAHKTTIGTRGSSSEAATNHLAFSFFAPRETLAVPVTVCEGTSGTGSDFGTMTFSGVQLYRVTTDSGFSLTGEVGHPYVDPYYESDGGYGVGQACSSWWTDAQSMVKRTVFMDDFVYSISERRIKVSDLRDLSEDVADVALVSEP